MLKNDIESAIETLIALKGAQPDQFEAALERMARATAGPRERERNASLIAESLIKGPFSEAAWQTLIDIKGALPRARGALAYLPREAPIGPQSIACHAMAVHGPLSLWAQALFAGCRNGFLPFDRQAAAQFIWAMDSGDEASRALGMEDPAAFAPVLRAFFSQPAPWDEIFAEANFCPVAWIGSNWIGHCEAEHERLALETLLELLPRLWIGAPSPSSPWMAALSIRHGANLALAEALFHALDERGRIPRSGPREDDELPRQPGPLLEFCRGGLPGPAFARVARLLALSRPEGLEELDDSRCSALYWLNARLGQSRSGPNAEALAEAFGALVALGADPALIAPQVSLGELANHPRVLAALEARQIAGATVSDLPSGRSGSL